LQLKIEKLVYGGDGLSRLPEDSHGRGKAVFIPFVLEGETVEIALTEQKSGFARGRVEAVVEASPHRVQPKCEYFGSCGGCHYQLTSYEHQLRVKEEILRETLRRTSKIELEAAIEVHPSPPWNYRNRSRLQIATTPEFGAGYFRAGSHDLLPVEQCPISSPLINRAIAVLWASGRKNEVPQGVAEIEFFANAEDSQMLVEISCDPGARRSKLREWTEKLRGEMAEIAGVVIFRREASGGASDFERLLSAGEDHLVYRTRKGEYRVSAGSFFQTNRHMIDELVRIVTEGRSGELAVDLYAGVGLFSTALSDFHHTVSVESSQTSSGDLSYNLSSNGEAVRAATEQYLARAETSGRIGKGEVFPHIFHKPDLAVVDPPRSGLGERVARMLAALGAPRVVYVSCDPATLARDLGVLLGSGYRIEQVHLVDLFPQTFHLESVVHLTR